MTLTLAEMHSLRIIAPIGTPFTLYCSDHPDVRVDRTISQTGSARVMLPVSDTYTLYINNLMYVIDGNVSAYIVTPEE